MTSPGLDSGSIIGLDQLTGADAVRVGSKAANLGELRRAGLPVPDGLVVTGDADIDVQAIARLLGDGPLAVRSSAAAEDLGEASFAGQYETVLDVRGSAALREAIQAVRASASSARSEQYRATHASATGGQFAVLVQRMLQPEAAGVAFTADPLSGGRDHVVITAARGLGERVVSGEAVGDEWLVREAAAECRRCLDSAIDAEQALAIARLARAAEAHMGDTPQDIEWAIEKGQLYLLQARPMTALPEQVDWAPPSPGYWLRTFRLGEWLSDPITPLFQTWLLERLNEGLRAGMREVAGAEIQFPDATINGWYYAMAGLNPREIPRTFVRALIQSRGRVLPVLFNALIRVNTRPDLAERALLGGLAEQWRRELLPTYQQLVADAERRVQASTPAELIEIVDGVARSAGVYFWSLAIVGGSAWKMEAALARFIRKHVAGDDGSGVQVLLRGLPGIELGASPHAVESIDWYWPPLGHTQEVGPPAPERRIALMEQRDNAERKYRSILADRPRLRARFDSLLDVAQRYAIIREEQSRWFTLGWPLMRRCVLRLGEPLAAAGMIQRAEDVFFLTRPELMQTHSDLRDSVGRRRAEWQRHRRLVAPLEIGKPPRIVKAALSGVTHSNDQLATPENVIAGQPASAGRATGRVRVVSSPDDFAAFQPGEVLVARATAPAWTPLFARAAAVVTDSGTLAAHASLVAREYGIPAVVGTTDATRRLSTGTLVTVDGSAGRVLIGGG
ncbi:MAG TPA: PEP/pyruvate-binding domain-containing protein [Chloroflexota bacterium]